MIDLRHENDTSTLRTDGRKLNETRQVSFELGTMQNTAGSAIFTIGNTKVAAFVQGPHQVSDITQCLLYANFLPRLLSPIGHSARSWSNPWRDSKLEQRDPERALFLDQLQRNGAQSQHQERHEDERVLSCPQISV